MDTPSVSQVGQVANISDPVIRNLNITQCYFELSQAIKWLAGDNAIWCTYGVWASKQAGQTIRKEDVIRTFEYYFRHSPEVVSLLKGFQDFSQYLNELPEIESIKESILKIVNPDSAFDRTAEAVAEGNKIVIAEIGNEFARFLAFFPDGKKLNQDNINAFCAVLKPGDPPDGQQLLKDAFTSYFEAYTEQDPKAKTELIHYSNLLIGLHEQTRVQPQILEALDSPFDDVDEIRRQVFKLFMPGFWLKTRYFLSKTFNIKFPLDELLDDIIALLEKQVREVISRFMMSLTIPGAPIIRLGSDLTVGFPPALQHLTNEKLIALLAKIDPTPNSLKDSGVVDWGDLNDRMHFIADYFRCYNAYQPLYNAPFTDEQVLSIKSGKIPNGDL